MNLKLKTTNKLSSTYLWIKIFTTYLITYLVINIFITMKYLQYHLSKTKTTNKLSELLYVRAV